MADVRDTVATLIQHNPVNHLRLAGTCKVIHNSRPVNIQRNIIRTQCAKQTSVGIWLAHRRHQLFQCLKTGIRKEILSSKADVGAIYATIGKFKNLHTFSFYSADGAIADKTYGADKRRTDVNRVWYNARNSAAPSCLRMLQCAGITLHDPSLSSPRSYITPLGRCCG
ncbi:hypothetical protein EVAR_90247_1 [Eumeta japonica]|uniref:Uncharacterized protein n=1 Tax=Eumeta variegata TaxID=151549 RepID=A0A4C1YMF8_EUMVA|nr:hypothetical protein EVAR_90247_1 [Eumeta japonica]